MSDTNSSQPISEDFQYPKSFEIAVSNIFVHVPEFILGNNGYSAKVMRNEDAVRLDISFHVKDDSKDIGVVSEKIFNFIEFVNAQGLDGLAYDRDTGVLTFDNAGYIVAALQEYIDANPDSLDEETLKKLDNTLLDAFRSHVPELIHEDNDKPDLKYPQCADAILSGMFSYRGFKKCDDIFGFSYSEGKGTSHSLVMVCPNMDGEEFPDPDDAEMLGELYDEISVWKPDSVTVSLEGKHRQLIRIVSPHPLETFKLIKALYEENNMLGMEDCIEHWDEESALTNILAQTKEAVLPSEAEKLDPANYYRMRRGIISHNYSQMVKSGAIECEDDSVQSDYKQGDELRRVPMGIYGSVKGVLLSIAIASNTNCGFSLAEIKARIKNELGETKNAPSDEKQKHKRFTIH